MHNISTVSNKMLSYFLKITNIFALFNPGSLEMITSGDISAK